MKPIIQAVDVGRGNTKYIAGFDEKGAPKCQHFRSITHASDHPAGSTHEEVKRKTVMVPLEGLHYEVGPDIDMAADVFNPEMLQNDRFSARPEYKALALGAMSYMKEPVIDLLVVGLPVAAFKQPKVVAALEKYLTGVHPLGKDKQVEVKQVKVLTQPHGALMYYGSLKKERFTALLQQRSLVIDCGRRTFDWVVTKGMTPIQKRSHSVDRGMFDVLQKIAEAISQAKQTNYRHFDVIDDALRNNTRVTIFQEEYSLAKHLPLAKKIPEQAVAEMMHYVGDASDIVNIVVVGGASFFFRDAVKKAFPKHKIGTVKDELYANVRGFQLAGEAYWKKMHETVQRDGVKP